MLKTVAEIDNMIISLLRERENMRSRNSEIARQLKALRMQRARAAVPKTDAYDDLMAELSTLGRTTS